MDVGWVTTEQLLVAITQISIILRKIVTHRRWPQFYTLTQTPASLPEATGGAHPHYPDTSPNLPPASSPASQLWKVQNRMYTAGDVKGGLGCGRCQRE